MDALARRALAREATVYTAYHNPNVKPGGWGKPTRLQPMHSSLKSLKSSSSSSLLAGEYDDDDDERPLTSPARALMLMRNRRPVTRARRQATAAALAASRSAPLLPGPLSYVPLVTPLGHEHAMADLHGAERMPTAAFVDKSPKHALPQDWQTMVSVGVQRVEQAPMSFPTPTTYRPAHRQVDKAVKHGRIPETNRSAPIPGVRHPKLAGYLPAPGQYAVQCLPTGAEYSMADLGSNERLQNSSFANRGDARSDPVQWIDKETVHTPARHMPSSLYAPPSTHYEHNKFFTVDATVGTAGVEKWRASGRSCAWGEGPLDPEEFEIDQAEKAAFHLKMHPPMPGPGSYEVKVRAGGAEFNMSELSGAERMQMSSFANRSRARGDVELWVDPEKLH